MLSLLITKGEKMTQARFILDDYTTRVLDVIKGKFGLKNRDAALRKFVHQFGKDFVDPEINVGLLKELDDLTMKHIDKYGYKSMKEKELDTLLNI